MFLRDSEHLKGFVSLRQLVAILGLMGAVPVADAVSDIVVVGLFKDKAVVRLDGKQRVLRVGQTSPEGVRLISADSQRAVLEVAGERREYSLSQHIASSYAAARQVEVILWPDARGLYLADGTVNDIAVRFLVDTGANVVAMNFEQARRIGLDPLREGRTSLVRTASGEVYGYAVKLDRVEIGSIAVQDVDAVILDSSQPTEVLLGMSFLSRVQLVREGKKLVLRQSPGG